MTISTLSLAWSLWLAVAVAVCAAVLIHNVRREIRHVKPRAAVSAGANRPAEAAPAGELSAEQVIAAAAYYWLHPDNPAGQSEKIDQ